METVFVYIAHPVFPLSLEKTHFFHFSDKDSLK